jgi:hypothetical protein
VALAFGVGLAHGHALAVLALLASATTLVRGPRGRLARAVRLRAFLPALLPMVWSVYRGGPPPGSSADFVLVDSAGYQPLPDKLSLLLTPTLVTRTGLDVAVTLALWVVILLTVVATRRGLAAPDDERAPDTERVSRAHSRALGFALPIVAASFFALPHAFRWFGFIDGRMVPVFLFVAILYVQRPALRPRLQNTLDLASPVAAVGMVLLVLCASALFQREARGYRQVLGAVPPEARVLNLPLDPNSNLFTAHPFVHYDKLIAVAEPALLSDVWPDRGTTLYPTAENPQSRLPGTYNSANLKRIDWSAYELADWDYVLVRTRPDALEVPLPLGPTLVAHVGGWWLYRAK